MIIQCDTREQHGKHDYKLKYFFENGIKIIRSKMFCGDYTRLENQSVCIDTKKDIVELAGNICGKQHERFRAECIKAKDNGIKLVILIEEQQSLDTLKDWKSPVYKFGKKRGKYLTQVRGEVLSKAMRTMTENYGVQFMFTTKENSGKNIVEILGGLPGAY